MFLLVVAAALIAVALGANVPGLDVSQPVSRTVADCFVRSGYKYLLIRAWFCVNGGVDSNAITTYNNLRAAGMPHIGFLHLSVRGPRVVCVGGEPGERA
jgi:hypothetical protein